MGTSIGTYDRAPGMARKYQTTHPWISFAVDLRNAPYTLWTLLGDARSRCEHIKGVPLRPDIARSLHLLYLAKGARATTAIEGNSLSEEEVKRLITGNLELPPSKEYLGNEVDNIVAACDAILSDLVNGRVSEISISRIKKLNAQVLQGPNLPPEVIPGQTRTYEVGVARYKGSPAEDCQHLLERLCTWLNGDILAGGEELGLGIPILKAILAHLYLAFIHPFGDGNGRTARLVEFQLLVSSGVPSPAAHLLSNHYNETRSEYYRQLDYASSNEDGPMRFILYALQGFVDGLNAQLELIRYQQWEIAWENYVREAFHNQDSPSDIRRRHLVLDLSEANGPKRRVSLPRLTPRLAEAYAGKTGKTLTRDINALVRMNLLSRTPEGYIANRKQLLAFLPFAGLEDAEEVEPVSQLTFPIEPIS